MSYIWVEGPAFEPIGDSLDLWLSFLRDRDAREAWLDVRDGREVCRVVREGGAEAWRVVWNGGIYMLHGEEEPAPARPNVGLAGMTEKLAHVVRRRLDAGGSEMRLAALHRAEAILASPGDGEEASDVAWPYFVLPEGASRVARRLLAAACALWPEPEGLPDPAAVPARGDEAVEASLAAIAAAVNSVGPAEPVE